MRFRLAALLLTVAACGGKTGFDAKTATAAKGDKKTQTTTASPEAAKNDAPDGPTTRLAAAYAANAALADEGDRQRGASGLRFAAQALLYEAASK